MDSYHHGYLFKCRELGLRREKLRGWDLESDFCQETRGNPKVRRPQVTRAGMLLLLSFSQAEELCVHSWACRKQAERQRKVRKDDFIFF